MDSGDGARTQDGTEEGLELKRKLLRTASNSPPSAKKVLRFDESTLGTEQYIPPRARTEQVIPPEVRTEQDRPRYEQERARTEQNSSGAGSRYATVPSPQSKDGARTSRNYAPLYKVRDPLKIH